MDGWMLGAAIARMFVAAAGNKLDLETSRQVTRANMNLSLAGSYSERLENHLGSLSLFFLSTNISKTYSRLRPKQRTLPFARLNRSAAKAPRQ